MEHNTVPPFLATTAEQKYNISLLIIQINSKVVLSSGTLELHNCDWNLIHCAKYNKKTRKTDLVKSNNYSKCSQ